jgi:hypothetical protein
VVVALESKLVTRKKRQKVLLRVVSDVVVGSTVRAKSGPGSKIGVILVGQSSCEIKQKRLLIKNAPAASQDTARVIIPSKSSVKRNVRNYPVGNCIPGMTPETGSTLHAHYKYSTRTVLFVTTEGSCSCQVPEAMQFSRFSVAYEERLLFKPVITQSDERKEEGRMSINRHLCPTGKKGRRQRTLYKMSIIRGILLTPDTLTHVSCPTGKSLGHQT